MERVVVVLAWCGVILYGVYSPPLAKVEKEWREDLSPAQCSRAGGDLRYIAEEIYSGYKGCLLPKGE